MSHGLRRRQDGASAPGTGRAGQAGSLALLAILDAATAALADLRGSIEALQSRMTKGWDAAQALRDVGRRIRFQFQSEIADHGAFPGLRPGV